LGEVHVFTIKEAAEQTELSEDTIRYYEKIGLLPRAERKENRHRIYHPEDIATMKLIICLKKTGMSLDEMKPFLNLSYDDDLTEFPELYAKIQSHKEKIYNQMVSLQQIIDFIDSFESRFNKTGSSAEPACSISGEHVRKPMFQK
jgi:MerR family copper efflux transcriptional regulator